MKNTLYLLICFAIIAASCDNNTQSNLPTKPFKLPDGSTAYPSGTLATHLDKPDRKRNAELLIWPDPLLSWLLSFGSRSDSYMPTSTLCVSDKSNFILIELIRKPHPDRLIQDHKILSFQLLAIEPHINTDIEQLHEIKILIDDKPTTVNVDDQVITPPQDVVDSASSFDPDLAHLTARKITVKLDQETYASGEYQPAFDIVFTDKLGIVQTDRIDSTFMLR